MFRRQLLRNADLDKLAQWLMDEGSVSVCYFGPTDITLLLVCGSMNDYEVLSQISGTLKTAIVSSKAPGPATLPMGGVRLQSTKAYALLEVIGDRLVGLKASEARAALRFFPPSGRVKGRHTTDEFLVPVWKDYAAHALNEWNSRRRVKMGEDELKERAETWVKRRIRRARRFIDSPKAPKNPLAHDIRAETRVKP
jgi:hypothetical protein